jgi:hypothetical protein
VEGLADQPLRQADACRACEKSAASWPSVYPAAPWLAFTFLKPSAVSEPSYTILCRRAHVTLDALQSLGPIRSCAAERMSRSMLYKAWARISTGSA